MSCHICSFIGLRCAGMIIKNHDRCHVANGCFRLNDRDVFFGCIADEKPSREELEVFAQAMFEKDIQEYTLQDINALYHMKYSELMFICYKDGYYIMAHYQSGHGIKHYDAALHEAIHGENFAGCKDIRATTEEDALKSWIDNNRQAISGLGKCITIRPHQAYRSMVLAPTNEKKKPPLVQRLQDSFDKIDFD